MSFGRTANEAVSSSEQHGMNGTSQEQTEVCKGNCDSLNAAEDSDEMSHEQ